MSVDTAEKKQIIWHEFGRFLIVSLYISIWLIWEGLSLLGLGPGQLCGKADEEAGTEEEQEAVVGESVAAGGKDEGDAEFEATSDEGPECTFVAGFCGTSGCGDTGRGGDSVFSSLGVTQATTTMGGARKPPGAK